MTGPIEIPPNVLKVFEEAQRLVDEAVRTVQQLPVGQMSASGFSTSTGSASLQIITPIGIPSGEAFGTPAVTFTAADVEEAGVWLKSLKALGAPEWLGLIGLLTLLLETVKTFAGLG